MRRKITPSEYGRSISKQEKNSKAAASSDKNTRLHRLMVESPRVCLVLTHLGPLRRGKAASLGLQRLPNTFRFAR